MGYTHNWDRPRVISPSTFNRITEDFWKVLPALEAAGSPIANTYGLEEPEITADYVRFNGLQHCGHSRNPEVRLPWPRKDACGTGSNEGVGGTLPHRTCNGDCSYQTFWFDRCDDPAMENSDGLFGGFCKTAFRPYDLAVTAFLLIAQHHLGRELTVSTDGDQAQWNDARTLCEAELGYGSEYFFQEGTLEALKEAR